MHMASLFAEELNTILGSYQLVNENYMHTNRNPQQNIVQYAVV